MNQPRDRQGRFGAVAHSEAEPITGLVDLTGHSPTEIDTELARLSVLLYRARTNLAHTRKLIDQSGGYERSTWLDVLPQYEREVADLADQISPLEDEFDRRGGWTRAFLVNNAGGHVHKSMECSTCFDTTQFVWLPEYSGADEDAIVADAGKMACTVCYPSAPADVLKRQGIIKDPQRKAALLAREAARAEKVKAAAVKGITNPDGSELVDDLGLAIKTEVAAKRTAADLYVRFRQWSAIAANEYVSNERRQQAENGTVECRANFERIVAAIAHKHGQSWDDALAELEAAGRDKAKREGYVF